MLVVLDCCCDVLVDLLFCVISFARAANNADILVMGGLVPALVSY